MSEKVLVIGAFGQIGTELVPALKKIYGRNAVIAADLAARKSQVREGIYEYLDVLDDKRLSEIVDKYKITQIYNLAAILSSTGEKRPKLAWDINMNGLLNVLEIAREKKVKKVFWPSSIAVFGDETPKLNTPQLTITQPSTVYGISKLAGELWCEYYFKNFGLDARSIRYPGLIGYAANPGGGTTDYAVDIFHKAIRSEVFHCYIHENTIMPMMYMPDAIRATIEIMEAPAEKITVRDSYNVAAMSFSPTEIAAMIEKFIPDFKIDYRPDFREKIASSWPDSIDDAVAKKDWGWKPEYDLEKMTADMLEHLKTE